MTEESRSVDALMTEVKRAAEGQHVSPRLATWLAEVRDRRGSDLYLVAAAPPALRVNGRVERLDEPPLESGEIEHLLRPVLPPHARASYDERGHGDASMRYGAFGRFRINLHRERGRAAASIRALPVEPPLLASLNLPPGVEALTKLRSGLVLIGGPTGSGKTTTVAALVDLINRREARHIVTIEDPIEYDHVHHRSIVEQVEIGIDAPDFPTALRSTVRQSPDVIVVGEMRDPETMRMALAAGETGHLVFSTLHTTDVAATIARVADGFPAERQSTVRQELSMALAAVMTQMLVPTEDGSRVPAVELLMVGYGARQQIRKNALQHLNQEITFTRKDGSFTLEECLALLVKGRVLSLEDARARAAHREEFDGLMSGWGGR